MGLICGGVVVGDIYCHLSNLCVFVQENIYVCSIVLVFGGLDCYVVVLTNCTCTDTFFSHVQLTIYFLA